MNVGYIYMWVLDKKFKNKFLLYIQSWLTGSIRNDNIFDNFLFLGKTLILCLEFSFYERGNLFVN